MRARASYRFYQDLWDDISKAIALEQVKAVESQLYDPTRQEPTFLMKIKPKIDFPPPNSDMIADRTAREFVISAPCHVLNLQADQE